jgi:DNA-binding CsgD family transcriptional regulator
VGGILADQSRAALANQAVLRAQEAAGADIEQLLSPREREIARLIAAGYPNKTIGGILDISPWTVATHIRRIFTKLRVHGRASMVARLATSGFSFKRPIVRPMDGKRG